MTLLAGTLVVKSKETVKKIRVAYQDRRTCISGKSNGLECSEQTLPLKL